ncbi:MAG: shikimate kinase [Pyrinomonadaceae bacterium]
MDNHRKRVILTGFMGVGKSTVARHLSYLLRLERIDLDQFIETAEKKAIVEIIEEKGIEYFRRAETENLRNILENTVADIIALGGGAWMTEENREIIKSHHCTTIWLESTFEHCWRNISLSKKKRPLVKNKKQVRALFKDRERFYCLADWHFIMKPELTSLDVAKQIAEEVFSHKIN